MFRPSSILSLLKTFLGWGGCLSMLLHISVMTAFAGRWDVTSAVTLFPIWVWAFVGMVMAGLGLRSPMRRVSAFALLAWLAVLIVCPDEWRSLLRTAKGHPAPEIGKAKDHAGKSVLRVATLNCGARHHEALRALIPWQPDIILLQERPWFEAQMKSVVKELWGDEGTMLFGYDCAILAHGKLTPALPANVQIREFIQATLTRPGGEEIEVVSLHLPKANTDIRLWRPQTWREHKFNHYERRLKLADIMAWQLKGDHYNPEPGGIRPCLLGGDFNAPAHDRIFQTLNRYFNDAFRTAGTGWANTYSKRLPVLRIDQIWATPEFTPVRSRVIKIEHSDHRAVIADFVR